MAVSGSRSSGPVLRSLSPCGRLSNSRYHAPPSASSLTKASASAVRFSFEGPTSACRSIASASPRSQGVRMQGGQSPLPSVSAGGQKKACMCSPTRHPGSFRCSLHKNNIGTRYGHHGSSAPYHSNRLNARRSAMTNSLVRIGTVEGDLVKRALAALIRPSSHQQRRRSPFQPRPSRLSIMSQAENL